MGLVKVNKAWSKSPKPKTHRQTAVIAAIVHSPNVRRNLKAAKVRLGRGNPKLEQIAFAAELTQGNDVLRYPL